MSRIYSDNEEQENTVEDKTFDLAVRKMKTKNSSGQLPKQLPKHVSEMSKFTEYFDGDLKPNILAGSDKWKFKI
jgi:hypothetical protein